MVDYKEILIKYIDIVGAAEGVTFISHPQDTSKGCDGFSKEEFEALLDAEKEAFARCKSLY